MPLPTLPREILVKIAAAMAKDRYWFLGPLIMAGKQGRDIVYKNKVVISEACIYPLCIDGSDISVGGRHRTFFVRCLEAENPIALYQEGIRVATQEGDIERGVNLLDKIVYQQGDATLAAAIFSICTGNREKAGVYLDMLSKNHHVGLHSEEVEEMGRELLIDICGFNPKPTRRYLKTLKFPTCKTYPVPTCVRNDHKPLLGWPTNCCNMCYVWWLANKVTWIL